ncbi:hypothetical protein PspLS_02129 [Pyricularia sp. CBS 133598]|nr:hypothetical protein PspLS_02129 [Pyricularia sp. CBS 133598]
MEKTKRDTLDSTGDVVPPPQDMASHQSKRVKMGNGEPGAVELWRHPDQKSTTMWKFLEHVNSTRSLSLENYEQLHKWSTADPAAFWGDVWHYAGVVASKPYDEVLPEGGMFPRPNFFSGALLNFAENLLFPPGVDVDPSSVAVITATETDEKETTWAELRDMVNRCAAALRTAGLQRGDVVAGYISNHVEALVAALGAASIGALWTGISPDNGVSAVLDRLVQVRPKVLFADNGTTYNGKSWASTPKTLEVVGELKKHGLDLVVVTRNLQTVDLSLDEIRALDVEADDFDGFLAAAQVEQNGTGSQQQFEQLPSDHPLFILYSSGTTGVPKAIVHSALGTLIQHKKEHLLHGSLSSKSRMLYFTTTSWMMWHWSITALSVGTSLVLYSGSPFRPDGYLSLPKLLSKFKVTHFGTSAAYLTALEANKIYPVREPGIDLSSLEGIYSTAAPLPPSTFAFVYEAFPSKVHLASITGGTDIISLFGAPCPLLPVRAGEVQCAGLGMAVAVVDSASDPDKPMLITDSEPGDLVCTVPFPCQPLTFFGNDGDEKYRKAYFERFPGMWHHGDFVRQVDGPSGGLVMLGRSDGVLKPAGVRFGSAEIYNILTKFFPGDVEDALCVGRRREGDTDEAVCLFVVPAAGKSFDDELKGRIKTTIRSELSPRHVPAFIEEAKGGIPKTGNGKKIEVAVKQIISGMQVKTNASVANPESLDWFRSWHEQHP